MFQDMVPFETFWKSWHFGAQRDDASESLRCFTRISLFSPLRVLCNNTADNTFGSFPACWAPPTLPPSCCLSPSRVAAQVGQDELDKERFQFRSIVEATAGYVTSVRMSTCEAQASFHHTSKAKAFYPPYSVNGQEFDDWCNKAANLWKKHSPYVALYTMCCSRDKPAERRLCCSLSLAGMNFVLVSAASRIHRNVSDLMEPK